MAESLRRQFVARAEGSTGPGFWQPLFDLAKLWRLPASVPAGALPPEDETNTTSEELANLRHEANRFGLYAIPILALLALVSAAVMLPLPGNLWPFLAASGEAQPLGGDLLALGLLALVPTVSAVIVGSLGGSVYGQLAGSRIFQLLVVCAFPYGVAVFGSGVARGTLALQTIVSSNSLPLVALKLLSGLLFLLAMPAILRLKPFTTAHSETLEGVTTELGGVPLALFLVMEWAERILYPAIFALLFIPFADNPLFFVAGFLFGLGVIGVVDNLLGQVRLRDALNFYIRYANPAALLLFMLVTFAVKV